MIRENDFVWAGPYVIVAASLAVRMATCPRCHGHLTDTHRCPRRRGRVAAEIILAALAGGLVALIVVALVDPGGQLTHIDTAAIAVGVFGGVALDRLLRS